MPFSELTLKKNTHSLSRLFWTILYRILSKSDVKCAPFSEASLSVKWFLQNSQVFDILRRISPISVQKYAVYEQKFIYALT